jgi:hypothetical protein
MTPKQSIILLSGIPATGKSSFAKHLVNYGFVHFDLECYPNGWPESQREELKELWDVDRRAFVARLRQQYDRVVLDWGFPIGSLSWVKELQSCDVKLVWFDGDIARARETFVKRKEKGGVQNFNKQVMEIREAGFPSTLQDYALVPSLSGTGKFLIASEIESKIFS